MVTAPSVLLEPETKISVLELPEPTTDPAVKVLYEPLSVILVHES